MNLETKEASHLLRVQNLEFRTQGATAENLEGIHHKLRLSLHNRVTESGVVLEKPWAVARIVWFVRFDGIDEVRAIVSHVAHIWLNAPYLHKVRIIRPEQVNRRPLRVTRFKPSLVIARRNH